MHRAFPECISWLSQQLPLAHMAPAQQPRPAFQTPSGLNCRSAGHPGLIPKLLLLFEDAKCPYSQSQPLRLNREQSWEPGEIKLLCDASAFVMHPGCQYICNVPYQVLSPASESGARRQRGCLGKLREVGDTASRPFSSPENGKLGKFQEWEKDDELMVLDYDDF